MGSDMSKSSVCRRCGGPKAPDDDMCNTCDTSHGGSEGAPDWFDSERTVDRSTLRRLAAEGATSEGKGGTGEMDVAASSASHSQGDAGSHHSGGEGVMTGPAESGETQLLPGTQMDNIAPGLSSAAPDNGASEEVGVRPVEASNARDSADLAGTGTTGFCTGCGRPNSGNPFCGGCGQVMVNRSVPPERASVRPPTPAAAFCTGCGRPNSGNPFCGGCGQALANRSIPPAGSLMGPVLSSSVSLPGVGFGSWQTGQAAESAHVSGLSIDRSWFARLRRGWEFTIRSLELMRDQPGLVAVPVIASAIILVDLLVAEAIGSRLPSALYFLVWVIGMIGAYTVGVACQAVIVVRVGATLNGEHLTNAEAFRAVAPRMKDMVSWAILSFTVGALFRSLENARGPIGWLFRLVAVALLISWRALTFFVIPVMIFEGASTRQAITRSKELVRQVWGEGVIGVGVLNVLFNLVALALFMFCVLLAAAHFFLLAVLLLIATIVAFNLLAAVVSPIFILVLYRFATAGELVMGFTRDDIAAAVRPRRRRAYVGG